MYNQTRRSVLRGVGAAGLAGILGTGAAAAKASELENARRPTQQVAVSTRQSAGNSVHWILPGPRRIDPHVFGTPPAGPSTPQRGDDHIAHKIWYFSQHRPEVVGLLDGDPPDHPALPLPVGLPNGARKTNSAGTMYTETGIPVPFSDNTIGSDANPNLDGELDLTYIDRSGFDGHDGHDEIDLDIWFTDPQGNHYEFDIHHLEEHDEAHLHGRGVMTGVYMHGTVPIGTPLMPTQYAFGSAWAIGDLIVNGSEPVAANRDRVIHFMTTQNVRTADGYTLAIDEELPLGEHGNPDPYLGSQTVTHAFLPPIQSTEDGPRMVPLEPAFTLPNGKAQPFIHVMFDEDQVEIEEAAFPEARR